MKRIILLICLISLSAVSAFSQADLQSVATVNLIRTEAITVRQLRIEVEKAEKESRQQLSIDDRRNILDLMINERLVIQAAERDRVLVTDNEVNQQIQQLRSSMAQQIGRQPTDAEWAQAIFSDTGLNENAFKEQIRREMIMQKYMMHKKGDMINSVKVPTEEEIAAEYAIRRTQLVRPKTVRCHMIEVPYGTDNASRARARELANRLAQEIGSSPSKFDEVMARSVAPNSGYQAGDAGYLPFSVDARNRVGQDFLNIAFSLKQGEVSRLIEGVDGFQFIKITENYEERTLELHDIMQFGQRFTVREYIQQWLYNLRYQETLAKASQDLVAELRTGRPFTIIENNLKW